MAIVFWLCVGAMAYVYVGYPLLLFVVSRFVNRRVTKASPLVFLIRLEITFEPLHAAIAFERQNVRRQPVQKPAIVADHNGAAGEVFERRLERL